MNSSNKKAPHKSTRSAGSVDDEVQKLFRRSGGRISTADLMKLRQRYDDVDIVDKIQRAFIEKHVMITKKAKKFAQLIREKYSNQQYPFHMLLEKAYMFKTKHQLTDDEFVEFQRIYEQELVGLKSPEVLQPATNLMKVLGTVSVDFSHKPMQLNDNDYKYLQEILKIYATSRPLHAQILLQSLQYKDCDFEALSGRYNRDMGHRPGEHIHPVIAALFLPRVDVLETNFLHANMASIIKARHNGEQLTNRPDYELAYALTSDPNDIVCDARSIMMDLLNRVNVQQQLWNCVLNLRNGQYYNTSFRDFIGSVDMCRLNRFDNPDLVYGRYDGTILKRLISAFSFRPTVVATAPIYNIINLNPYQQNVRPIVTSVPMINLRLPPTIGDNTPVSLNDALEQHQYFIEGGAMVPRHTSLIYSRGVLFFFVDRRTSTIHLQDMQPFNLASLPISSFGFERMNDREVDFETKIMIRDDEYQLRSVVVAEVNKTISSSSNVVIGSSTMILLPVNHSIGRYTTEYAHYDPAGVVTDISVPGVSNLPPREPVMIIKSSPSINAPGVSFQEAARKRGMIFMYQLVKEDNHTDNVSISI